ncbi:MAG: hypothetical protein WCE60_04595 [Methanobacterium sp.]
MAKVGIDRRGGCVIDEVNFANLFSYLNFCKLSIDAPSIIKNPLSTFKLENHLTGGVTQIIPTHII